MRLTRERDFLTEMSARRFRFMALFGQEAGQPFLTFIQTSNRIGVATRALVHDRDHLRSDQREEFEMLIGWTAEETDPVRLTLNEAVERVEIVCKPVLECTALGL